MLQSFRTASVRIKGVREAEGGLRCQVMRRNTHVHALAAVLRELVHHVLQARSGVHTHALFNFNYSVLEVYNAICLRHFCSIACFIFSWYVRLSSTPE